MLMPRPGDKGEVFTLREVADFLKVTERTIYRLAAAKQIPAFKVGGSWRFLRTDIARWIRTQCEDRPAPDAADNDQA